MNENMILNPGETILYMNGSYGKGKSVHATRVFPTVDEFRAWLEKNAILHEIYPGKKKGDVVSVYHITWGSKKGYRNETVLVTPGYSLGYSGQFYIAHPEKVPRRFDATPEMLGKGYVSGKIRNRNVAP